MKGGGGVCCCVFVAGYFRFRKYDRFLRVNHIRIELKKSTSTSGILQTRQRSLINEELHPSVSMRPRVWQRQIFVHIQIN